jgi:hypothetical protein
VAGALSPWRLPHATFRTNCENDPMRGTVAAYLPRGLLARPS